MERAKYRVVRRSGDYLFPYKVQLKVLGRFWITTNYHMFLSTAEETVKRKTHKSSYYYDKEGNKL